MEGRAVDLCLPDEGRARNSGGKLQGFTCLVPTEDRRGHWIPWNWLQMVVIHHMNAEN